jgi:hypothetical protein
MYSEIGLSQGVDSLKIKEIWSSTVRTISTKKRIKGTKIDITLKSTAMLQVLLLASLVACGLGEYHIMYCK